VTVLLEKRENVARKGTKKTLLVFSSLDGTGEREGKQRDPSFKSQSKRLKFSSASWK
jgi:hypothetical protein